MQKSATWGECRTRRRPRERSSHARKSRNCCGGLGRSCGSATVWSSFARYVSRPRGTTDYDPLLETRVNQVSGRARTSPITEVRSREYFCGRRLSDSVSWHSTRRCARQQIALLDLVIDIVGSDQRLEIGTDPGQPIRRVRET